VFQPCPFVRFELNDEAVEKPGVVRDEDQGPQDIEELTDFYFRLTAPLPAGRQADKQQRAISPSAFCFLRANYQHLRHVQAATVRSRTSGCMDRACVTHHTLVAEFGHLRIHAAGSAAVLSCIRRGDALADGLPVD